METTNTSGGYLTLRVSTARGAIPLEGALVKIREGEASDSSVIYSLTTDRDGRTQKVTLPTQPISESSSPNGSKPYTAYDIEVFKQGYIPVFFKDVPIFPSILSVQNAVLIPIPEGNAASPYPPAPQTIIIDEEGGPGKESEAEE